MSDGLKAVATSVSECRMALKNRVIDGKLVFYSDRGVQYACTEFRKKLNGLLVEQSMTGPPVRSEGQLLGLCFGREFF